MNFSSLKGRNENRKKLKSGFLKLLPGRCFLESECFGFPKLECHKQVHDINKNDKSINDANTSSRYPSIMIGDVVAIIMRDLSSLFSTNFTYPTDEVLVRVFLCQVSPSPPLVNPNYELNQSEIPLHFDTSTFLEISLSGEEFEKMQTENDSKKQEDTLNGDSTSSTSKHSCIDDRINSLLNLKMGVKCEKVFDIIHDIEMISQPFPNKTILDIPDNFSVRARFSNKNQKNQNIEMSAYEHEGANNMSSSLSCGFISRIPSSYCDGIFRTLMSLTLVPIKEISMPGNLRKENKKKTEMSLLLSCIKREMVGRIISINSITKITFPVFDMDKMITTFSSNYYRVSNLSPVPSRDPEERMSGSKKSIYGAFIVEPNTSITIIEGEETIPIYTSNLFKNAKPVDMQISDSTQLNHQPPRQEITSHAVRVLLQTILAIHDSVKHDGQRETIHVPKTFVLSGPPGVGKTHAVRTAIAHAPSPQSIHLTSIRGSEILGLGHITDAMAELRRLFHAATYRNKSNPLSDTSNPSIAIIFLDECDALLTSSAPLISAQLGVLLDRISSISSNEDGYDRLIVVAATNRIDSIPIWLRRPGRFDREIVVTPPHAKDREKILRSLLQEISILPSAVHSSGNSCEAKDTEEDSLVSTSSESTTSCLSLNHRLALSDGTRHEIIERDNFEYNALNDEEGLTKIAEECVGYVAADLAALVRRAMVLSLSSDRPMSGMISVNHLKRSMIDVGASALRDAALSAPPATRWNDIAGDAGGAKRALRRAVEWPQTKRESFRFLGLSPPRGILLHGPPGCAKTTLARAAAGSSGIAFLSLSPADVYASSYVGEAESIIRRAFTLARSVSPSILFFDEIDAILGCSDGNNGSNGMNRGSSAEARVMSTFLNEMDGVDASNEDGVLVLGATNRPATLDAALLRPGRFDSIIYVPPPDFGARRAILKTESQRWQSFAPTDFDPFTHHYIDKLAKDCASMTGAEIVGACREASMSIMKEILELGKDAEITTYGQSNNLDLQKHVEKVFSNVKPLLSDEKVLREYSFFNNEHNSKRFESNQVQ